MMLMLVMGIALTCDVLPGFRQEGPSRLYEGENLFEYMNGNSEGYLAYGFVRMNGITCTKGPQKVLVDISEMPDAESAYGLYSSNRDMKLPAEKIGAGGQIAPRKAIFVKGKHFVEIAAEAEGDHSDLLRAAARTMAERVEGATTVPVPIGWFPSEGLTAGPPRLVPQSVLGVRALKRGYMAQYGAVKAFVVREPTNSAAIEVLKKWLGRYPVISEAKVAGSDQAVAVTDQYLGIIVVASHGGDIVGTAGAPLEQAGPLIAGILARLPQ